MPIFCGSCRKSYNEMMLFFRNRSQHKKELGYDTTVKFFFGDNFVSRD